jgi:hypothetical protein
LSFALHQKGIRGFSFKPQSFGFLISKRPAKRGRMAATSEPGSGIAQQDAALPGEDQPSEVLQKNAPQEPRWKADNSASA